MNSEIVTNRADDNAADIEALKAEFVQLEEDFGDLGLSADDPQEDAALAELAEALQGTEFEAGGAESVGTMSLLDLVDAPQEEGWISDAVGAIGGIFKRRAKKMLKRALKIVRKAGKYRPCLKHVTAALKAYKSGKFGATIKHCYKAMTCIASKS